MNQVAQAGRSTLDGDCHLLCGRDLHYVHPDLVALYDSVNPAGADTAYYLRQAPIAPARILDVGCGTGGLALRFAGMGHDVTAIDPAPSMLEAARAKDGSEAVDWRQGDIASISGTSDIDLAVMTGHAFQCLLSNEEIRAGFERIAKALRPGGRFIFETRNRALTPWERWTACETVPIAAHGAGPVTIKTKILNVSGEIVSFEECYRFSNGTSLTSETSLRFASPGEILQLASGAGLHPVSIHGDWEGGTYRPDESREWIATLANGRP
jgi:SAM-dependent methyltransferase